MSTANAVTITRSLSAMPEQVFEAWTDPKLLVQWFVTASHQKVIEAQMDVRPGGSYRIEITDPEDRFVAFGDYKRVERPHLLEFTWQWEESSIEKGVSLVTLELLAVEGGTHLTLTHSRLSSEKSVQAHTSGWTAILSRLEDFATKL